MGDKERQDAELETVPSRIPFFAFEGMGGSGKSHIIRALEPEIAQAGFITAGYKISGMGTGERTDWLRKIKEYRTHLISTGEASEKQMQDARKDRIFMLGMRYQMRKIMTEIPERDNLQLILLDRTPLMPWVYSISTDDSNPFLGDILRKGIDYAKQLHIDTQYLFDISPETAYARMIARICTNLSRPEEVIERVCNQIGAPSDSADTIRAKTLHLLDGNHAIVPKSAEGYSFISFKTMINERKYFMQAASILNAECDTRLVVVNAELQPEEVTSTIYEDIKRRMVERAI